MEQVVRSQISNCQISKGEGHASGGSGAAQRLVEYDLESESEAVCVEMPVNIQAIRKANLPLAMDWRRKTREIFETYFERGYVAVDFDREEQRRRAAQPVHAVASAGRTGSPR